MQEKKKLGVALVGLGLYSNDHLAPALQQTKNCRLAGIVTGTPEKAERYKQEFGIPDSNIYNYDDFDSIADNDEIDIVYVVLPNALHATFTIRAANAGKHVICEKPMATTVQDAEQMIHTCDKNNVRLFIGYRLHYEPFHRELRRFQREKTFGDVLSLEAGNGFAISQGGIWRLDKKLAGGGPLMDAGIYCIQAARYATGKEPFAVTAQATYTDNPIFKGVESDISWTLEFPDGVSAFCKSSYTEDYDFLKIRYSNGWAKLESAFHYSGQKGETSQGKMTFPHIFHQVAQLESMAEEILSGKETTASGMEGLQDMRILEAIYKAAETGANVEIGELERLRERQHNLR